jgi:hypothetical protein
VVTYAESTVAKVHQNNQLKLPLESTLDEKQGDGGGYQVGLRKLSLTLR